MTRAEIYRRAAELVFDGEEHGCIAIACAQGQVIGYINDTPEMDKFALFKQRDEHRGAWGYYWGLPLDSDRGYENAEEKRCKIVALCFAAAMADAGDL